MNILIFAQWKLLRYRNSYYIQSTHNSYIEFLNQENIITLLCLVEDTSEEPIISKLDPSVNVIALPGTYGYFGAYSNILKYNKFFDGLNIENDTTIYIRNPDPLTWFASLKLIKKDPKKIIHHYVGDSIDATLNAKQPLLYRLFKIIAYLPEFFLMLYSSKYYASKVICNGTRLRKTLGIFGINSESVISSTVSIGDIKYFNWDTSAIENDTIKFLYVGYVRPSKGVLNALVAFNKFLLLKPNSTFTIVGAGESLSSAKNYVLENGLTSNVNFLGHIDERSILNDIYSSHDCFLFPSLSEGSPRVVVEAMSNGLAVISTPVGSLSDTFVDGNEICIIEGFTEESIYQKLVDVSKMSSEELEGIAKNGYSKVKAKYTKEKFLSKVFYE
ncbi:glycosyltransferase family 4 protein [Vibrio sp. 10N.261.55.F6]|uniref:glycosyltransferase family 4 protein n=1 Tax=Vibrio sp. 10N.261.55.F6 TaxID=3229693 RepID=UPI003553E3AD